VAGSGKYDDLGCVRRAGVIRQRGSGRTRGPVKISSPGSLVAASVCHAACRGGDRRRPCPGSLGSGRRAAVHAVPAPSRAAGLARGGHRGRGGDPGVPPGAAGAVPGMRFAVLAGSWRYARVVADGAAAGRPVLVVLSVRRFRCPDPSCAKVTFAEQAEGLTARYRRRSVPLLGMLACGCREPYPRHATRRYSLIRPPTRAVLRTRYSLRSTGSGSGFSGAALCRKRCGRCWLW
jgi:hypothetical protein